MCTPLTRSLLEILQPDSHRVAGPRGFSCLSNATPLFILRFNVPHGVLINANRSRRLRSPWGCSGSFMLATPCIHDYYTLHVIYYFLTNHTLEHYGVSTKCYTDENLLYITVAQ